MDNVRVRDKYVRRKIRVLKDFGVAVTPEMRKRIESLYPNDILVENYTRKIILQKLGN